MKSRRGFLQASIAVLVILGLLATAGRSAGPHLGGVALSLRATMFATLLTGAVALAVGLVLGVLGGIGPRLLDTLLRFSAELAGAFPTVISALVLIALAPGMIAGLLALGALRGLELAWLFRSELYRIESTERDVVRRTLGHTPLASFFRKRLPRSLGPALVSASSTCAWLTAIDAALCAAKLPKSLGTLGALAVSAQTGSEAAFAVLLGICLSATLYVLARAFMPERFQAQE